MDWDSCHLHLGSQDRTEFIEAVEQRQFETSHFLEATQAVSAETDSAA
jgi:hypothetical protein